MLPIVLRQKGGKREQREREEQAQKNKKPTIRWNRTAQNDTRGLRDNMCVCVLLADRQKACGLLLAI